MVVVLVPLQATRTRVRHSELIALTNRFVRLTCQHFRGNTGSRAWNGHRLVNSRYWTRCNGIRKNGKLENPCDSNELLRSHRPRAEGNACKPAIEEGESE